MPLSPPSDREPIHERRVECRGYRRSDGLWDVEGHIVDIKTYDFDNTERGHVAAGTPVHEMWVRITIDDDFLIHDAEASTEHAPYGVCPQAAPGMEKLKGVRIGAGWRREINKRVGGTLGCTHLRELLGPMATTAFQTIAPIKMKDRKPSPGKRPPLLGTCHAYAPDSPVVKRLWPEHYREPEARES
ncbi:MAG: DUF2889 domain-containing protein [Gammaproteobacteria bacterium]|nr:DUF2889 domain-containing protein [Gammaproteobacteria bacterium]